MSYDEFHGHFLTRDEVARVLHCRPVDVTGRRDLLRLDRPAPGEEIHPARQFDGDGRPTPGMDLLVAARRRCWTGAA